MEDGHERHHKRRQEPQGAYNLFRERCKAEIHKRFALALRRRAGLLLIGTKALVAPYIGDVGHDDRRNHPKKKACHENGTMPDRQERKRHKSKHEGGKIQLPQKVPADLLNRSILPHFIWKRYAENDVFFRLRFIAQHEVDWNKAEIQYGEQNIFHDGFSFVSS